MSHKTTNRPSASTAPLDVICEEFRFFAKNTLVGFATLSFPAIGLRVHDCAVHITSDRRTWIAWPANNRNGTWVRIVEAIDCSSHFRLQAISVKAIQKHLDSLQAPAPPARPRPAQPSTEPSGPPKAEIPDQDIPL
jgi:hypothetical protein